MPFLTISRSSVLLALGALALAQAGGAQTLNSSASVAAGNLAAGGGIPEWYYDSEGDPNGMQVSASGSHTFTGLNSTNVQQTMTYNGSASASADYGVLHAAASSTLGNPYYNVNNAPYYVGGGAPNNAGSAQYFTAAGKATFTDTLFLNPFTDPIVSLEYFVSVDGSVTDANHAYAYVNMTVDDNQGHVYSDTQFTSDPSTIMTFGSEAPGQQWLVTPNEPIDITTQLAAVVLINTNDGTPEGVDVNSTADYSNTAVLSGIELFDAAGQQVTGATYYTGSGTQYNILGATYQGPSNGTPEPGSIALLSASGIAGALIAIRKRKRNNT